MKIETKYDIGQEVWFKHKCKPQKGIISSISLTIITKIIDGDDILYHVTPTKLPLIRFAWLKENFSPPKKNYLKVCRV